MLSNHIQTQIIVNTKVEDVWQLLTDFDANDCWNPMFKGITGDCQVGQSVKFEVQESKNKRRPCRARFTRVEVERELTWEGESLFGLTSEHYFRIQPLGSGGVWIIHGERFKGALLTLVGKKLQTVEPLYQSLNQALKAKLERSK